MATKESVLALIKEHLPFGADLQGDVKEDSLLVELGLDSMHLIMMLLMMQREYSIDMESMTENGMPSTIADLVALVEGAIATDNSSSKT